MQIACRDRNRIAIQGDVLGAAAMGVRQHPLPDRRRRAGRRPARRQAGVRSRFAPRCWRPSASCATRASSCRAARSPRRRRCSWARPSIRSRRPTISGRSISPRRSRPAPSSSRPSTASTCRCCANSWTRCASRGCIEKAFILVGVGPLASAKTAQLDALQRAGRPHSRRRHQAARGRAGPEDGRQAALHRHHPARSRRSRASPASMSWPTGRRNMSSEIITDSGVLQNRQPRRPAQDQA